MQKMIIEREEITLSNLNILKIRKEYIRHYKKWWKKSEFIPKCKYTIVFNKDFSIVGYSMRKKSNLLKFFKKSESNLFAILDECGFFKTILDKNMLPEASINVKKLF